MEKYRRPRLRPRVVGAMAIALALVLCGSAGAASPVKKLVDFSEASVLNPFGGDPSSRPEGITPDGGNGFFVTGFVAGRVYHVDPSGRVTLFAQLPASPGGATTGIARDGDGNLYVAHRAEPEHMGVWKIGPAGGSHQDDPTQNPDAPRKFFPFDPAHTDLESPNGVTLDRHGDLFVSDSRGGRIHKVARTSTPEHPQETIWAEGPELSFSLTGVGANGLQAEHAGDSIYAVNFDQGTVMRLSLAEPVSATNPIETLVSLPPLSGGLFLDGLTIDAADERLYVTAAGRIDFETFTLAPGEEILALDLRRACLDGGPLPATSTGDPRLTSAAKDPLLGVATDVALSIGETHLFTVDLDFLNAPKAGGGVLRTANLVAFPDC